MAEKGIQTANGKAFEYACVLAIYEELREFQKVEIVESPQMSTAKSLYEKAGSLRNALTAAAKAAIRVIQRLEPQIWNPEGNEPLYLSIQPDAAGIKGDVRDVLCIRQQNGWQIGLSCKHNHHAVKHSRLSDKIDFGKEWFGIPCSESYFAEVVPLFSELRKMKDESKNTDSPVLWEQFPDKSKRYYIPILQAFMRELKKLDGENQGRIPGLLVQYLLGKHDFYKVITDDKNCTTRIEAMNLNGTLNKQAGAEKPIAKVTQLKMPTRFYHIGFKDNSENTIEVVCDEGWQISMRIHNASSKVEPSLKFDVNLISVPSSVHTQIEPWDEKRRIELSRIDSYKETIESGRKGM